MNMICPYCGCRLSKRSRCERCGEDMTLYKKAYRIANQYYNTGLKKAQIRDLSGAAVDLKNCLKLDKKHTDARNLLGLIYFELGETVSALSEWVVSKHFQGEDNIADHYIELVQESPNRLDAINQVIKKYNGALSAARQNNNDLAVIQLKKVVSLNPHYVKALQLLALLYIKANEKERARKCLLKALKIDVANTTTLSYLEEIRTELPAGGASDTENAPETRQRVAQDRDVIIPVHTYKEDKPNYMAFVNLIIGIGIGVAFMVFAIVPGIKKSAVQANNVEIVELNDQLVKKDAELDTAKASVSELEQKVKDLQYDLEHVEPEKADTTLYDTVLKAANEYMLDQKSEAATTLSKVDRKKIKNNDMLAIYDRISGETFEEESAASYTEGHNLYTAGKFEEALTLLAQALELNPANLDAIYFTGRSYHRLGDVEKAKVYYNQLIDDYPDSGRAAEAKARLREIQ